MQRTRVLAIVTAAALAAGGLWWRASGPPASEIAADASLRATYQCPMHPQVVSERPANCPICGMTLSRVEAAPPTAPPDEGHGPPSHAAFSLSPGRAQAIGVATATVEFRELHRDVRTAGKVAFDPDLYRALTEYREAHVAEEGLTESSPAEARQRAEGLRRALAVRLNLLGLSFGQVGALLDGGADPGSLLVPGQSAWIYGQVYETAPDTPRPGHPVVVTTPALPGRFFHGEVVTVDSASASTARGVRVRALVATPGGGLRPETFVRLVVQVPLGRRLALPESAVLDTGVRSLVFVQGADGRFEPRDVVLGVEAEEYHEVLAGLAPGERVVTAANFLIDSESRFRAALEAYGAAVAHGAGEAPPGP